MDVSALQRLSQSLMPCAPKEMAPGVWVRFDCIATPIHRLLGYVNGYAGATGSPIPGFPGFPGLPGLPALPNIPGLPGLFNGGAPKANVVIPQGLLPPTADLRAAGLDGPIKNQGGGHRCLHGVFTLERDGRRSPESSAARTRSRLSTFWSEILRAEHRHRRRRHGRPRTSPSKRRGHTTLREGLQVSWRRIRRILVRPSLRRHLPVARAPGRRVAAVEKRNADDARPLPGHRCQAVFRRRRTPTRWPPSSPAAIRYGFRWA